MAKKTVKDVDVAKKKVLVRVDFNVPSTDNRISVRICPTVTRSGKIPSPYIQAAR